MLENARQTVHTMQLVFRRVYLFGFITELVGAAGARFENGAKPYAPNGRTLGLHCLNAQLFDIAAKRPSSCALACSACTSTRNVRVPSGWSLREIIVNVHVRQGQLNEK
uniref:Secreted protein n=1 Tax=Ascaris lumbricoides TaxID=6252 RepID=A0A0M3IR48_ASCLU